MPAIGKLHLRCPFASVSCEGATTVRCFRGLRACSWPEPWRASHDWCSTAARIIPSPASPYAPLSWLAVGNLASPDCRVTIDGRDKLLLLEERFHPLTLPLWFLPTHEPPTVTKKKKKKKKRNRLFCRSTWCGHFERTRIMTCTVITIYVPEHLLSVAPT